MTNRIQKYIFKLCSWYISKFKANGASSSDDSPYETLTPKLKTDGSMPHYFSALEFAFSKNEVRNIAVTGPYGAGKSTVIQSFLTLHQKTPHVNVSLAGFDISGKGEPRNLDPREVELSILQQILYRVGRDVVPDSRIDRIQNRNTKHVTNLFFSILSVALPVIMLFGLIYPHILTDYLSVPYSAAHFITNNGLFKVTLLAVLFVFSVYQLTRIASRAGIFDKKIKLSKIAFLTGDAEVQGQESTSLLNNCLDEIVYFFSRSNYLTVVFEDLDRLGTSDIFIKLREINKIINNSKEDGEPVRFIYAVRDDIFLGSDVRTKFFDYIVPVIPVMDSKNSYSILKSKIIDFPKKDLNCLRGASRYINDMRSLQNVINEYNLFMRVVGSNENNSKLFTLIFYKNIFALDYNLVDKKMGVLYSYMADFCSRKLHSHHFGLLNNQLSALQTKLEKIANEIKDTANEVREELLGRFIAKKMWQYMFFYRSNNGGYNWNPTKLDSLAANEDSFIDFFSGTYDPYIGYNPQNNLIKIDVKELNSIVDEYRDRVPLLKGGRMTALENVRAEVEIVKERIRQKNSISLEELTRNIGRIKFEELAKKYISDIQDKKMLTTEQEDSILSGFKYGGYDAIYYFISNGYLTHDYMMYRSVFHKGSITVEDNEFVKQVGNYIDHASSNELFILQNVEDVSRELIDNVYILREGAFHHQVISYLLGKSPETFLEVVDNIFSRNFDFLISILRIFDVKFNHPETFFDFISASVRTNEHFNKLIKLLRKVKREPMLDKLLISLMINPDFKSFDKKTELKGLAEEFGWSLISAMNAKQLQQFMGNASLIGVKFSDVSVALHSIEESAITYLVNDRMYAFNQDSFYNIISGSGFLDASRDDILNRPWSFLRHNDIEKIYEYAKDEIDSFVENVFLKSQDDIDAIVSMLKNDNLSIKLKKRIILELYFLLHDDFCIFPDDENMSEREILDLYDLMFANDKVSPSWISLSKYASMDCSQEVLLKYVARHAEHLSLCEPANSVVVSNNVYKKILCNEDTNLVTQKLILQPLFVDYSIIDELIPIDNLKLLIEDHKINLSIDVWTHIKSLFGDSKWIIELLSLLLFKNSKELVSNADFYFDPEYDNLFPELIVEALSNNEIPIDVRLFLFNKFSESIDDVIMKKIELSYVFMEEISKSKASDEVKLILTTSYIKNSSPKRFELINFLGRLDNKDIQKVLTNKAQLTLRTELGDVLNELLKALKSKKFISNFDWTDDERFLIKTSTES